MRHLLASVISSFVLVLQFGSAAAQSARVELYSDATMSNCEIVDDGVGIRSLHVFFTGVEATQAAFTAPIPECWLGATFVGENWAPSVLRIGTTQEGADVAFAGCKQPPFHLVEVLVLTMGVAAPCCEYVVLPHPGWGFGYTDCQFDEDNSWTPGHSVVINPDDSCRCQQPVASEETTWGRVKSLYR